MIKKLDILIVRSFIGPFIGAFAISLFVLTMQFFWLYIDDLVGKGLDIITVLKLVGLVTLFWVPTALPLALLFSSILYRDDRAGLHDLICNTRVVVGKVE